MDKRIFITLIAIILLIGAFIGIRSMLNDQCEVPEIIVEPASPEAGQVVKFSCPNVMENITWDFADGKTSSGRSAMHQFDSSGVFNVVAKVGDNCTNTKEVIVHVPRKLVNTVPLIDIPAGIRVGEEVRFTEIQSGAAVKKWTIIETKETVEGETFTTTFKSPGVYHIKIAISGNYVTGDSVYTVEVLKSKPVALVVIEKKPVLSVTSPKPKPKPQPAPYPRIEDNKYMNDHDFKSKFDTVAEGFFPKNPDSGQSADDWKNVILKQVCSGQYLQIVVIDETGKSTPLTQEGFVRKLGIGDYTEIKAAEIARGKENCISRVIVKAVSK